MAEASCQLTQPCQQHQLISRQLQSTKRDRGDQGKSREPARRSLRGHLTRVEVGSSFLLSLLYPCHRPKSGASWCPPKFVSSKTVLCVAKATPCICTAAPELPLNETASKNSSLPQSPKSFHMCVHECMCMRVCVNVCVYTRMCVCAYEHASTCEDQRTISGVIPQVIPTLTFYLLIIIVMCIWCGGGLHVSQCAWHSG